MGPVQGEVAKAGQTLGAARSGEEKLVSRKLAAEGATAIDVRSPDFFNGGPLPKWASCDGEGKGPEIRWGELPAATQSLVVVCEDPDAPMPRPFVHHLVYGLAPTARSLNASLAGAREGRNGEKKTGFTPAAPPPGHGAHRYYFQVFALARSVTLEAGAERDALADAMKGAVIGYGEIVGTYERG